MAFLEDTFNSYTDGDLNGQGSWTAAGTYDIQGTTVYEGTKALQQSNSGSTDQVANKTGTQGIADGSQNWYSRLSVTTGGTEHDTRIKEGATYLTVIRMDARTAPTATIKYRDSVGYSSYGNFSVDTWYLMQLEWRSSDKKFRFAVDAEAWTDWYTPLANFTTDVDNVELQWWSSQGANGYWDNFSVPAAPPVAGMPTLLNAIFFGTNC